MNVLFCSVEGVLYTNNFIYKLQREKGKILKGIDCEFDPEKVDLLNRYCFENKVYLILLTNWATTMTFEEGVKLVREKGIKCPVLALLNTANTVDVNDKINNWLNRNRLSWKSIIKWGAIVNYMAIQSQFDIFNIKMLKNLPVIYCSINGLTKEVIDKLKL